MPIVHGYNPLRLDNIGNRCRLPFIYTFIYAPNYILEEEDNAPSLVNNLVPPPDRDQEKNSERSKNEVEENKELEDPQDMDKRHVEEDSEWEVDKEEDYSEYCDFSY